MRGESLTVEPCTTRQWRSTTVPAEPKRSVALSMGRVATSRAASVPVHRPSSSNCSKSGGRCVSGRALSGAPARGRCY